MNLQSLIDSGANINLTVTPADLKEFALTIVNQCRDEFKAKEQPETYHSRKETMRLLNICTTTLWDWGNKGYLVPIKVGAKSLYKHSDIQRILKQEGGAL